VFRERSTAVKRVASESVGPLFLLLYAMPLHRVAIFYNVAREK